MKLNILITGRNRKIASDLREHLESDRGYTVIGCPASKEALFERVPAEMPHVIIICLGDETQDTVGVYDVLRECVNDDWITIMVVANEEDSKYFINNTRLKKMLFISRPVSLIALYSKLAEIEKKAEYDEKSGVQRITEYINPKADEYDLKRKNILIVDDDPQQLLQIKEHLKEFYNVTAVRTGESAFKYLEKHIPDMILLDYIMPGMDGPTVLINMRMIPEYERIPVVFLTGVAEKEKVIKTIVELKPQGYIVKPAKKSDIVAKIIDVLG